MDLSFRAGRLLGLCQISYLHLFSNYGVTHRLSFTHPRSASSGADQRNISLNHQAEKRYHPRVCRTCSGNTFRKAVRGEAVVRGPTCICATRIKKTANVEMNKRRARRPQTPRGNHDQRTINSRISLNSSPSDWDHQHDVFVPIIKETR